MITKERIAELRAELNDWGHGNVLQPAGEFAALLDAAETALAMQEDMARIDYRNRCVEDMLNRATDDTRAIRDIVTKWMFAK